ncbi:hypothetical protein DPEC_G00089020 [Dallia pectoralis]|uniref:Uncharacterized protein n=1 Tax=Dallia pectoralis TaxID=75939 RepID=A0ACC2H0L7_DALPE|nr:hypothetical protein DPEC_G00089020 [Dallia pectoralis]
MGCGKKLIVQTTQTDGRERAMTMDGVYKSLLELLMILLSLITDVSGYSQYSSVGDNVILPCRNVVNQVNCSSTTWTYNRAGTKLTMEEVQLGKIKKGNPPNRADRLSLGSDCSLHVSEVRAEDAGLYTCQQFLTEGGGQDGVDEAVYLSVLNISSSTPVTELKPGETVTIKCSLHTYDGKCNSHLVGGVTLNLYETDPEEDVRPTITTHSRCEITLDVTVRSEDNNRKWTCELNDNGQVKTSIDFLATLSGLSSSNSTLIAVGVVVAVGVAVCVIAVVIKVHRRRTTNHIPDDGSLVCIQDLSLNAINPPTPPVNDEQSQPADSIAYASISHFSQNLPQRVNVHGEDTVTYASVKTATDIG